MKPGAGGFGELRGLAGGLEEVPAYRPTTFERQVERDMERYEERERDMPTVDLHPGPPNA